MTSGVVAQMVEHQKRLLTCLEVGGSMPPHPIALVAQWQSIRLNQPKGRTFESCRARFDLDSSPVPGQDRAAGLEILSCLDPSRPGPTRNALRSSILLR